MVFPYYSVLTSAHLTELYEQAIQISLLYTQSVLPFSKIPPTHLYLNEVSRTTSMEPKCTFCFKYLARLGQTSIQGGKKITNKSSCQAS